MAFMMAMGRCCACKQMFSFNPDRVPSVRVSVPDGPREPICRGCVERANPERVKRGLAPITVLPGAYEAEEVA